MGSATLMGKGENGRIRTQRRRARGKLESSERNPGKVQRVTGSNPTEIRVGPSQTENTQRCSGGGAKIKIQGE